MFDYEDVKVEWGVIPKVISQADPETKEIIKNNNNNNCFYYLYNKKQQKS